MQQESNVERKEKGESLSGGGSSAEYIISNLKEKANYLIGQKRYHRPQIQKNQQ
jgi:hypothetical protein